MRIWATTIAFRRVAKLRHCGSAFGLTRLPSLKDGGAPNSTFKSHVEAAKLRRISGMAPRSLAFSNLSCYPMQRSPSSSARIMSGKKGGEASPRCSHRPIPRPQPLSRNPTRPLGPVSGRGDRFALARRCRDRHSANCRHLRHPLLGMAVPRRRNCGPHFHIQRTARLRDDGRCFRRSWP
jgi:hypothetical protein